MNDNQITAREYEDSSNTSIGSSCAVLSLKCLEVNMFFPKLSNFKRELHRVEVSQGVLSEDNSDPDRLNSIIIHDEKYFHRYGFGGRYLKLNFCDVSGSKGNT